MNYNAFLKVLILITSLNMIGCSNDTNYLEGLTIVPKEELNDRPISLDGETIPIYDINGERLIGDDVMLAMFSGNFGYDCYMDDSKEIKAIAFREATAQEKAIMNIIQQQSEIEMITKGETAPAFNTLDIEGNRFCLDSLKGKIIVINFWFIHCKPCVEEIPDLNELTKKYENKNIEFLSFTTDGKESLDVFLNSNEYLYHIIPNSNDIANDFRITSYPTNIVIDTNSKIAIILFSQGK